MATAVIDYSDELKATAQIIATRGKGILAADERNANIGGKFAKLNLENTKENRIRYRELLFTTENFGQYCSGVILNEETLFAKASDGTDLVQKIIDAGVVPGIKCDTGTRAHPYIEDCVFTQGLQDLHDRAARYYAQGARFAKWRNVLKIQNGVVNAATINDAATTLAVYASVCQQHGLCPIVEPEVVMDGDHDILTCQYWTRKAITATYAKLIEHNVMLEGTLLKPNMVLNGKQFVGERNIDQNAALTAQTLRDSVPVAVPAICFLSGGQSEEEATLNLNAINQMDLPWTCTFSYGRALQGTCLATWQGNDENAQAAQDAFFNRAKCNGEAQLGTYDGSGASEASKQSLYVKGYTY